MDMIFDGGWSESKSYDTPKSAKKMTAEEQVINNYLDSISSIYSNSDKVQNAIRFIKDEIKNTEHKDLTEKTVTYALEKTAILLFDFANDISKEEKPDDNLIFDTLVGQRMPIEEKDDIGFTKIGALNNSKKILASCLHQNYCQAARNEVCTKDIANRHIKQISFHRDHLEEPFLNDYTDIMASYCENKIASTQKTREDIADLFKNNANTDFKKIYKDSKNKKNPDKNFDNLITKVVEKGFQKVLSF